MDGSTAGPDPSSDASLQLLLSQVVIPVKIHNDLEAIYHELGMSEQEIVAKMNAITTAWKTVIQDEFHASSTSLLQVQDDCAMLEEKLELLNKELSQSKSPSAKDLSKMQLAYQRRLHWQALCDAMEQEKIGRVKLVHETLQAIAEIWTVQFEEPMESLDADFKLCCRADELHVVSVMLQCKYSAQRDKAVQAKRKELDSIAMFRREQVVNVLLLISKHLATLADPPLQELGAHAAKEQRFSIHFVDELARKVDKLEIKSLSDSMPSELSQAIQSLGCSKKTLQLLESRADELKREIEQRSALVKQHMASVKAMYGLLQLPMERYNEMLRDCDSVTADSIHAWKLELFKLKEMKRTRLQLLIEQVRNKLYSEWESMGVGRYEKPRVQSVIDKVAMADDHTNDDSDDSLECVLEIVRTEEQTWSNSLRPQLERVNGLETKWNEYLAIKQGLEEEMNNPERLLAKSGKRVDLLKEEKMRKQIAAIPRVLAALMREIEAYEALSHRPLVKDVCYRPDNTMCSFRDTVQHAMAADEEEKEMQRQMAAERRNARLMQQGMAPMAPKSTAKKPALAAATAFPNRTGAPTPQHGASLSKVSGRHAGKENRSDQVRASQTSSGSSASDASNKRNMQPKTKSGFSSASLHSPFSESHLTLALSDKDLDEQSFHEDDSELQWDESPVHSPSKASVKSSLA